MFNKIGANIITRKYSKLIPRQIVARTDENFQRDLEIFADANQMLKKFMIDGSPLYMIIDHLNNVEIL